MHSFHWQHVGLFFSVLLSLTWETYGTPTYDISQIERQDSSFVVKHSWSQIPKGWRLHDEPPPLGHLLNIHIGLKVWNMSNITITAIHIVILNSKTRSMSLLVIYMKLAIPLIHVTASICPKKKWMSWLPQPQKQLLPLTSGFKVMASTRQIAMHPLLAIGCESHSPSRKWNQCLTRNIVYSNTRKRKSA